jgi:hydrogenase/urease accessory protein HupE
MLPWLLVGDAAAHQPGVSYARVADGELALVFAEPELAERWPVSDLDAAAELVADGTIGRSAVSVGGQPCALGAAALRRVENDGVEIRSTLVCPEGETWTYRADFLADFEDGHRQYVEVNGEPIAVLDSGTMEATFAGQPAGAGEIGLRWLGLGVEHIWTGYDHLAFLFALLLAATGVRQMLTVVTGFTVAHSITLALAATGVFTLPPRVVEPAIAASIVLVGLENLWKPPPERRIVVTFLLGLVHGFGFAGMLAELGLPSHALGLALFSFNLGVELGQAAVVLVALPLLLVAARHPVFRDRAVPSLSLAIAAAGAWWLFERLLAG